MLEIRLLGTFEVTDGGKIIAISSRPAQSLFAYLVLNAGIAHRREKLAGMLWPDAPENNARGYLRHALWRIRKELPVARYPEADFLLSDDLSITFNSTADYWLDCDAVTKLDDSSSADDLMTVLAEYKGELLPGFYQEWVELEREHLSAVFEHHMARLLSLLQEEGRWLDILDWGERWIMLGQKPEPAYRSLMSAHAAKGDMRGVAATFERCVETLAGYGMEPSHQTQLLYDRLKAEKNGPGPDFITRERRSELQKTNLPVPSTSFIGREKEMDELIHLMSRNRFVTVLGSGGMGKTRLVLQAASKLLNKFQDGIWWIDLTGLTDDALVPVRVCSVIELSESTGQLVSEAVIYHLKSQQVLLILDHCDHLALGCAQLVDRLLGTCMSLKILATSREALDILDETPWHVPSLELSTGYETLHDLEEVDSIGLFVEQVKAIAPRFSLTEQNANSIVQICNRLSGIPLAIELAAAQAGRMKVDEIASRLDIYFRSLTSGSGAAIPRPQTLHTTLDWIYGQLTEPERTLLRRVAVFAGSFTLAELTSDTSFHELGYGDIFDLLGSLVEKSLVVMDQDLAAVTRYRMPETIREYILER